MRNMSEEKKLKIKSELVKHLTTAKTMKENNVPSSQFRIMSLEAAIEANDLGMDMEPDLGFWNEVMAVN